MRKRRSRACRHAGGRHSAWASSVETFLEPLRAIALNRSLHFKAFSNAGPIKSGQKKKGWGSPTSPHPTPVG